MRAYACHFKGLGSFTATDLGDLDVIKSEIDSMEIGSTITVEIKIVDMTQEEVDALPEFDGF